VVRPRHFRLPKRFRVANVCTEFQLLVNRIERLEAADRAADVRWLPFTARHPRSERAGQLFRSDGVQRRDRLPNSSRDVHPRQPEPLTDLYGKLT
jgi:hypothetical protein